MLINLPEVNVTLIASCNFSRIFRHLSLNFILYTHSERSGVSLDKMCELQFSSPKRKDEKERATIKNVFSRSTLLYALE